MDFEVAECLLSGTQFDAMNIRLWPIFAGWSSRNPRFGKLLANQLRPSVERSKSTRIGRSRVTAVKLSVQVVSFAAGSRDQPLRV